MTRRVEPTDFYVGGPVRTTAAMCVRCGRFPRMGETFVCHRCKADPVARREIVAIMRSAATFTDQRRIAIERFHWVGGWGRRA